MARLRMAVKKWNKQDGVKGREKAYAAPCTHRSAVSVCLQREPRSAACQWASGPWASTHFHSPLCREHRGRQTGQKTSLNPDQTGKNNNFMPPLWQQRIHIQRATHSLCTHVRTETPMWTYTLLLTLIHTNIKSTWELRTFWPFSQ